MIKIENIKRFIILILPSLVFIFQFINIGSIHLSWEIYLLLGIILIMENKRAVNMEIALFVFIALLVPIITFTYSSTNKFNLTLYFSITTGCLVMIYIFLLTEKEFYYFMDGIFISCILYAAIGLVEMLTGQFLFEHDSKQIMMISDAGTHYPISAFTNSSDLAQYLALMFPISAVHFCSKCGLNNKNKMVFLFFSGFIFFIIERASSNLAIISMICCYIFFGGVVILVKRKLSTIKIAMFIFVGLIISLYIVNKYSNFIPRIMENIFVTRTNVHYTIRADIYSQIIDMSIQHPFGGFGNAYSVFDPHNLILYIFCDYGLLIGILFVFVIVDFIIVFFDYFLKSGSEEYLMLTTILMVFPLLSSISSGNEQRKAIYFFIGICMNMRYRLKRQRLNNQL